MSAWAGPAFTCSTFHGQLNGENNFIFQSATYEYLDLLAFLQQAPCIFCPTYPHTHTPIWNQTTQTPPDLLLWAESRSAANARRTDTTAADAEIGLWWLHGFLSTNDLNPPPPSKRGSLMIIHQICSTSHSIRISRRFGICTLPYGRAAASAEPLAQAASPGLGLVDACKYVIHDTAYIGMPRCRLLGRAATSLPSITCMSTDSDPKCAPLPPAKYSGCLQWGNFSCSLPI